MATIAISDNCSIRIDVSLIDQRHSFWLNNCRRKGEGLLGQKECLGSYVTGGNRRLREKVIVARRGLFGALNIPVNLGSPVSGEQIRPHCHPRMTLKNSGGSLLSREIIR